MSKIKNWSRRQSLEDRNSNLSFQTVYAWTHDVLRNRKVDIIKEGSGKRATYDVRIFTPTTSMAANKKRKVSKSRKFNDREDAREWAVKWMRNHPNAMAGNISDSEHDQLEFVHDNRPERSQSQDERKRADSTFDRPVSKTEAKKWRKDKDRHDIEGIDD